MSALAALLALTGVVPLSHAASAAPADASARPDGLVSYVGMPVLNAQGQLALPQPMKPNIAAAEDDPGSMTPEQQSYTNPLAVPAATPPRTVPFEPSGPDVDNCLNSSGAQNAFGRVYNRFMWCQRFQLSAARGAIGEDGEALSTMTMNFDAVAYGRDDATRSVTVFFRADSLNIEPLKGYIRDDSMLYQRVVCSGDPGCGTSQAYVGLPLADWVGHWVDFTIDSDRTASTAADLVLRHKWSFDGYLVDSFNFRFRNSQSEQRNIRCDSATYWGMNRAGACIFDDVIPHLQYSVADPKVAEVAQHIQCAQDPTCITWPLSPAAKSIPGKFVDGQRNDFLALHRVRSSTTNSPIADANRAVVTAACAQLPIDVLDRSAGQQCDEYPFASTMEGAACCAPPAFDWDYSIKGVDGDVNRCAGNALKAYYRNDRILLNQDGFFVEITNTPPAGPEYCDAIPPDEDEPEDGGGTPPPDLPPTANAGPDVSGSEGSPITLNGAASDPELGTPHVTWGYRPLSGVDPGATCSFANTNQATTTVSCTDDGVFELTLSAYDGSNPPVSDSALLTLSNVAPDFRRLGPNATPASPTAGAATDPALPPDGPGIVAPLPWQVFRVGDPVSLVAAYSEPGSNDTHTCATDWDDGTSTSYPGVDLTCRATHTFTHPGMYTIRPSVTDDDGGVSQGASVMVIVYDPEAGFATEGGFINSPAGALTADPSVADKLSVELNPDYLPGDTGPTVSGGKVSASLHGAAFSLSSSTLDWLVVAPDDRVAVKGTGTVNGQAGYGFVAYGFNNPDAIRLVVWPLDSGPYPQKTLTYDNRAGADYDLDVCNPQPLDGGSLQIHD